MTSKRRISDGQVTEQRQGNSTKVQEIDKEVTNLPRQLIERKEKVEGEDVAPENLIQAKRLQKPKKTRHYRTNITHFSEP